MIRERRLTTLVVACLLPVLSATPSSQAAFPGTNGMIAFKSDRDGNDEIYEMNSDGSGQTNLTNNPAQDVAPFWSADGTRITFTSYRDGNGNVLLMGSDGSGQANLTRNEAYDGDPSWSPDGSRIAYVNFRSGNGEVYSVGTDSTGLVNLTRNGSYNGDPCWSPDGTKVAFVTNRGGNSEVYVMSSDGSGQTNLTSNAAQDFDPCWSPDGSKIVFASNRDGNREIYTMNANGSGSANLTRDAAQDFNPAWSPDGTKIAFASNRDGDYEVYVMNADASGSGLIRLTDNGVEDRSPDWQPVPSSQTEPTDTTAPVITQLTMNRRLRRRGTIRYTLSEKANVTFKFERRLRGVRRGQKCARTSRKKRRRRSCNLFRKKETLEHAGTQGANILTFKRSIKGHKLPRSRYRLVATAIDAAGNVSKPKRRAFRVI